MAKAKGKAENSEFVQHTACEACGSSDAKATYTDGHTHCFSCGATVQSGQAQAQKGHTKNTALLDGECVALPVRHLTQETCKVWNYAVGNYHGQACQIANYADSAGRPVAQKLRFANKDFKFIGETKKATLYGQHLWRSEGKMVVVTEGEIDAMSVSQVQANKWPVVSVPNGAQGAAKAVAKSLEWLESFERVVFMLDMDEPGQAAALECAELLTPGKAYIARLPLKDANEMLAAGRGKEIIDALWGARAYRPDGIVSGADLSLPDLMRPTAIGLSLPYPLLQGALKGLRPKEITLLTAGSGIGKSAFSRELAYHLVKHHKVRIANIYLEESIEKTAQGIIALDNNVPLGELRANPALLTAEQYEKSKRELVDAQFFYRHFGSLESDVLVSKIRYFAVGLGCDFAILDHISMVVSDQEGSGEGERKDIDRLMTRLRSLVEQTGIGVLGVVHLKRPQGGRKSYNEGAQISLSDLRGSAALEQLSDNIVALERNQQDEEDGDLTRLRLLKNRELGVVGAMDTLRYHRDTGRMLLERINPFAGSAAAPADY